MYPCIQFRCACVVRYYLTHPWSIACVTYAQMLSLRCCCTAMALLYSDYREDAGSITSPPPPPPPPLCLLFLIMRWPDCSQAQEHPRVAIEERTDSRLDWPRQRREPPGTKAHALAIGLIRSCGSMSTFTSRCVALNGSAEKEICVFDGVLMHGRCKLSHLSRSSHWSPALRVLLFACCAVPR